MLQDILLRIQTSLKKNVLFSFFLKDLNLSDILSQKLNIIMKRTSKNHTFPICKIKILFIPKSNKVINQKFSKI